MQSPLRGNTDIYLSRGMRDSNPDAANQGSAAMQRQARLSPRHPEVLGRRPSLEGSTAPMLPRAVATSGPCILRGALRAHLRMTGLTLAVVAAMTSSAPAQAQSDYPSKPITLVVPLPPGGTN